MYDYKLLEAFTAVIDHKGFDKAAQVLFITQSAVSQRVKQLEETLGRYSLSEAIPPLPPQLKQVKRSLHILIRSNSLRANSATT